MVEVFPGTTASPNAQYVVLQMYFSGQTFVSGESLTVYDADDKVIGTFGFSGNLANGADQAKILIATTQAASFFNVTANLAMSPVIRGSGGKICWAGGIDCVSWGNYRGSSTGVGTPFRSVDDGGSIPPGRAMVRRLNIAGSPTVLDGGDDTNNSLNDFVIGTPAPKNNANQAGTIPPATCGNGTIEGLEACDDHNLTNGDGCKSTCVYEGTVGVGGLPAVAGGLRAGPNPFRVATSLSLTMQQTTRAHVAVFDLAGRQIRTLWDADLDAGPHDLAWDGRDQHGEDVRAGVYVVRVRAAGQDARLLVTRLP